MVRDPPLYEYAEYLKQIIQVPISHLNVCGGDKQVRYKPKPLFIHHSGVVIVPYDRSRRYIIGTRKELEITTGEQRYEIVNGDWLKLNINLRNCCKITCTFA